MDVLRTTSLFGGFNEEQLEMVPKIGRRRSFEPGDIIVEKGATGAQSLWLVLEGEVDVMVGGEVHRTLGPGTHFGELALLTEAPRSADVVARTQTLALEFSRNHLDGLIAANPQVAVDMLAELAMRLRRATEALAEVVAAHQADDSKSQPDHLGAIEYALQGLDVD